MPYIFRSRKEFSYWFANPMNNVIEGASNQNEDVVRRLHEIIRPFILRRLKKDVETQMPGKFEHIIKCQLSRRQVCYHVQRRILLLPFFSFGSMLCLDVYL